MWDVFAVSTYFSVSTIFFYIGLIPDIASVRDRTRGAIHQIYKGMAFGWRGTDRQWRHYMAAYGFFCSIRNTTRTLCTLCGFLGLRDGSNDGMALYIVPSLLRSWCDLLWLCDGNHPDASTLSYV